MSPSEVERHPAGYRWSQRFPDHEEVLLVEGGAVYAARGEGAFWVIMDEGTLADLCGDDAGDLGTLITLERFDDEVAWLARIAEFRRLGRRGSH
jgi:hypothetical protein